MDAPETERKSGVKIRNEAAAPGARSKSVPDR